MRITIFTQGSRGDTQPYVALGVGLQRAGHQVRMPASEIFRELITEAGVEFVPARMLNSQELLRQPDIQALLRRAENPLTILALFRFVRHFLNELQDEYWRTSADADLLVASMTSFGIFDCAEKRGVPCVYAPQQPMEPTRAYPNAFVAPWGVRFNHPLNPLTHQAFRLAVWELARPAVNEWRRKQGLAPHPHFGYYRWQETRTRLTLYGFSPSVLPCPPDWPAGHHITGYWFLDEPPGWQPPADLVRFLDSGPPPVYLGFGSLSEKSPERLTQVCREALRLSGQRGILLSGWGGLSSVPASESVYSLDSIPHSWLFPRMAACVHHGGMGTTAAALRAGVPQVIVPVGGDQSFWAERMTQLGVGERCASFTRLTAKQLAAAITRAVTDPARHRRAAELGSRIRAEGGVDQAVRLINQSVH